MIENQFDDSQEYTLTQNFRVFFFEQVKNIWKNVMTV